MRVKWIEYILFEPFPIQVMIERIFYHVNRERERRAAHSGDVSVKRFDVQSIKAQRLLYILTISRFKN